MAAKRVEVDWFVNPSPPMVELWRISHSLSSVQLYPMLWPGADILKHLRITNRYTGVDDAKVTLVRLTEAVCCGVWYAFYAIRRPKGYPRVGARMRMDSKMSIFGHSTKRICPHLAHASSWSSCTQVALALLKTEVALYHAQRKVRHGKAVKDMDQAVQS